MNQTNERLSALLLAICAVFLSGCSGEPSNSDVKSLVEREVKPVLEAQVQALNGMAGMLGGNARKTERVELKDVKKVGCKSNGESAYLCDVELVMQVGENSKSQITQMRFVKGSNGWALTR